MKTKRIPIVNTKKPTKPKEEVNLYLKYQTVLKSWDFARSSRLGMHIFKFDYVTNGYESSCFLPLTFPLPQIDFTPNNIEKWYDKLLKIIKQPLVLAIGAAASVANLLALSFGSYTLTALTYKTLPLFLLQNVGLGMSIICLSSALVSYLVYPLLRRKIKARLDSIENQIKQPGYENSILENDTPDLIDSNIMIFKSHFERLDISNKISLISKVILHDYSPGNMDLKWRYHYLNALSKDIRKCGIHPDDNPYVKALSYCETEEQRFLCLRGAINSIALWRSKIETTIWYQTTVEELIKPYVEQISSKSISYKEFGKELRNKLNESRDTLISGNFLGAVHRFTCIEFDKYSAEAYPDIAVMYNQLDAILGIIGYKRSEPESCLDDGIRIENALCNLNLICQNYIYKYYTNKTMVYKTLHSDLRDFEADLPTPSKPKPGIRILFSPKIIITQLNDDESEACPRTQRTIKSLKPS